MRHRISERQTYPGRMERSASGQAEEQTGSDPSAAGSERCAHSNGFQCSLEVLLLEQPDSGYDCTVVRFSVFHSKREAFAFPAAGASGCIHDGGKRHLYSDGPGGAEPSRCLCISRWHRSGTGRLPVVLHLRQKKYFGDSRLAFNRALTKYKLAGKGIPSPASYYT